MTPDERSRHTPNIVKRPTQNALTFTAGAAGIWMLGAIGIALIFACVIRESRRHPETNGWASIRPASQFYLVRVTGYPEATPADTHLCWLADGPITPVDGGWSFHDVWMAGGAGHERTVKGDVVLLPLDREYFGKQPRDIAELMLRKKREWREKNGDWPMPYAAEK